MKPETISDRVKKICEEADKLLNPFLAETLIVASTSEKTLNNCTKTKKRPKTPIKRCFRYHPSISRVKSLYPNIDIPKKCSKWDLNPVITISCKDPSLQNNKMPESNTSTRIVNPKENTKLSSSFARISENTSVVLTDVDVFDSKSNCSFSSTVSSKETDDLYSDASNVYKNSKINRHNEHKCQNDSIGKELSINKSTLVEVQTKTNQESSVTKSIVENPAEKILYPYIVSILNAEQCALLEKNILEATLSAPDKCNAAIVSNQIETVMETKEENMTIVPKSNEVESTQNIYQEDTPEENKCLKTKEDNMIVLANLQHDRKLNENEEDNSDNSALVEISHTRKLFICQTCNVVLDTQKELKKHKKRHQKNTLRRRQH